MKSIQNQYKDLMEGRMSQTNFMRNIRMTLPQYITNVTSFNDSIKILKNKRILFENIQIERIVDKEDAYKAYDYYQKTGNYPPGISPEEYNKAMKMFGIEDIEDSWGEDDSDPAGGRGLSSHIEEDITGQQIAGNPSAEASMRKAFKSQAFEQGKQAAIEGTPLESIPFDETSKEGQDWVEGWFAGGEQMIPDETPFDDVVDSDGEGSMFENKDQEIAELEAEILSLMDSPSGTEPEIVSDKIDDLKAQVQRLKGLNENKKIHPNQIHPHELYIGTKVEMEHTDDIKEAEKIALDHLAENPFYYTALKLSGIDAGHDRASTKKRTDIGEEVGKNNFVDKGNQMKTPKGIEAVKASANKAKPETNKTVKGVKELGHVAKSVRGVKKMDPTGSKMKKINVKESLKTLIKGMVLEILNEDKK